MCTRIKFKYAFRWVSSRLIKDHRDAPAEGQNYPRAASHAASRGREHSGCVGKPSPLAKGVNGKPIFHL